LSASSLSQVRLRTLLRVLIALVLLGLITHATFAGSGDEPHYLAIAHSIAFDRDLDLANNYGGNEPLIAAGGLEAGPHVRQGRGGVTRPVHDVGMPLLFAPLARVLVPFVHWIARTAPPELLRRAKVTPTILYRHHISVLMIALAIILASLMFDTYLELGGLPRAAFATTLLVALSPPLMIYSALFFTELPSALLCFYAFRRVALDLRDLKPATLDLARRSGTSYWFTTGAAIGLLMLVHVRNAGLVIALVALGVNTIRQRRAWADLPGFAAALALALVARTVVTYYFWGTLVSTPHGRLGAWEGMGSAMSEAGIRLAGLLFDQEFGLIVYAPIYALALAGLIVIDRSMARRLLLVEGCYLALVLNPITNVHGWTGGWSPAARMLVPIVPLLAVPLLAALRALPRPIVVAVIAVQIAINAYMWQNPKNLWNDGDGIAAICARGRLAICEYLPSLTTRTP
jgi:hypothetical protein